jgi:hypothetical protein
MIKCSRLAWAFFLPIFCLPVQSLDLKTVDEDHDY